MIATSLAMMNAVIQKGFSGHLGHLEFLAHSELSRVVTLVCLRVPLELLQGRPE